MAFDLKVETMLDEALWIANSLFKRNKVSGSSANLSFLHKKAVYITRSGCSFGKLVREDFSIIDLNGETKSGASPSKEFPLHLSLYHSNAEFSAVIHTHSFYATLWSCVCGAGLTSAIPQYTPYLKMKLGEVMSIPYAPPGSNSLFSLVDQALDGRGGYLLCNHGPLIAASDLLSAFYALEELEEASRLAWLLRNTNTSQIS